MTEDGQHAAGLRFGDPRVMAVLAAVVNFAHLPAGFDNSTLTRLVADQLDAPYTARHATYDAGHRPTKPAGNRLARL